MRAASPDVPITTNFMGFCKRVDYWTWAPHVDIVVGRPLSRSGRPASPRRIDARDLMRSLGGGRPWLLMEHSTSAVNWQPRNVPKAPGQMRATALVPHVARGADGILFFQWRQSRAGAEKFHSGMLPHGGTDTRVWREIEQLGGELQRLSGREAGVEGSRVPSSVAIALDWDSWWALEQPASPTSVSYLETLFAWHHALTSLGLAVDFVRADADLSAYRARRRAGALRRDRRSAREPRGVRGCRRHARRRLRHRDHRRAPARAARRVPRRAAPTGARGVDRGVRAARRPRPAGDRRWDAAAGRARRRGVRRCRHRERLGRVRARRRRRDDRDVRRGALAGWPAVTRRASGPAARRAAPGTSPHSRRPARCADSWSGRLGCPRRARRRRWPPAARSRRCGAARRSS